MNDKTAPAGELTDEQINCIYQEATLQSLRPHDYRLAREFARAIIAADRALRANPVVGDAAIPTKAWLLIDQGVRAADDVVDYEAVELAADISAVELARFQQADRAFELILKSDAQAALATKDSEISKLNSVLIFVERWANHHGAKPHMTAQEALGCIQHHPRIRSITQTYADGQVPETRNPYAEIAALTAERDALKKVINGAWESYERYGETSVLEGQPLIYASVLGEIHDAAMTKEP